MKRVSKPNRSGFTLIELIVTISIIVLLVGLLVPAINGVRATARVAEVKTEISSLEAGIADFKANFGMEPPSRITLHGSATRWDSDPRSRSIIRRFWPQFNFSGDGAGGTFIGDSSVTLDGPECLVFFLGGVRNSDGGHIGFSKNPSQPFSLKGDSRTGPFFQFKTDRLLDLDNDSLPEYADAIPDTSKPYLYVSSYDGQGYNPADLVSTSGNNWMDSIYTQDGTTPHNPKTFQIISAGFDGEYGPGGEYNPDTADAALVGPREPERDNITNFSGGRLAN